MFKDVSQSNKQVIY